MSEFDIIIATDLRFPGGSSASTFEEVHVCSAKGWRVGLYHLPSPILMEQRHFHEGLARAMVDGRCALVNMEPGPTSTKLLLFRHPSIVHPAGPPLPKVTAEHVLVIVNHPPFNVKGRMDYVLPYASRALRKVYGVEPRIFPIGPLLRKAVSDAYGAAVEQESTDWSNTFDVDRFRCERRPPGSGVLRIGRHSRAGREKWPASASEIRAAYPDLPGIEVHVLGGAEVPERILGAIPANWTVHRFGALPAEDFLRGIDVFVYFHHANWIEAFGRAIAEAMAAGLPAIVPDHFRPLFDDAAIYAAPEEVASKIERLRDPAEYEQWSSRARDHVVQNFGPESLLKRLLAFGLAPGRETEISR